MTLLSFWSCVFFLQPIMTLYLHCLYVKMHLIDNWLNRIMSEQIFQWIWHIFPFSTRWRQVTAVTQLQMLTIQPSWCMRRVSVPFVVSLFLFSLTNLAFPVCPCWWHCNFYGPSNVMWRISVNLSPSEYSVCWAVSSSWQKFYFCLCFISFTFWMNDWLEWLLMPAAVQQVTLSGGDLDLTLLFWLAFIILSVHLKSFRTPLKDYTESVKIYEGCVAHHAATLGDAPHANMTPVAWQPDRQRSDPPFWAEQQGPALFTLISHYRTV